MPVLQEVVSVARAKEIENTFHVLRRSVDARQKSIKILITYDSDKSNEYVREAFMPQDVSRSPRQVVIVGAGPAGLFCALQLLEQGIKPIILEQGKDVSERKKDIAALYKNVLNTSSNYCFGLGGAGTFSDGKLFTRSKDKAAITRVLRLFHSFGAPDTVLYDAHAHIGSDKLPAIVDNMRKAILQSGGEIHFENTVTDLITQDGIVRGVIVQDGNKYYGEAIVFAIGHSARRTYAMLLSRGVAMQPKGFAMGVRIEHPQELINKIFFHQDADAVKYLGNAPYAISTSVDERGVYSFCMCPGGIIVPATAQEGCCVVNGMSNSRRNSPFANAGFVVEIRQNDYSKLSSNINISSPLCGMQVQQELEVAAWQHVNGTIQAPAQRITDFLGDTSSQTLPPCSFLAGVVPSALHEWLPTFLRTRLQRALCQINKKYSGFITEQGVLVGVESRTSSPVRLVRENATLESVSHKNLYPIGEGAGYAGGITSSAIDGLACAKSIAQKLSR